VRSIGCCLLSIPVTLGSCSLHHIEVSRSRERNALVSREFERYKPSSESGSFACLGLHCKYLLFFDQAEGAGALDGTCSEEAKALASCETRSFLKVLSLHFHGLDYTPTTSRYLSLFLTTTYDSIRRASTPTPFPLYLLISKSTLLLQQLEPRGSQAWRSSITYLCLKRANVEGSRSLSFVQLPHRHFPLLPLQLPPHPDMMQLNAI